MSGFHMTFLMRHGLAWMSDPQYRLAWIAGPPIGALLTIGNLFAAPQGTAMSPGPAPWVHGQQISDEQRELVSLRDRARTEPGLAAELEEKANSGNSIAQFMMGTLDDPSLLGRGATEEKTAKALVWYRKAEEKGSSLAAFNLGVLLIHGRYGIAPDYAEGHRLLAKIEPVYPAAERELGIMIHNGWGVRADGMKGIQVIHHAAERGDAIAAKIYGQVLDRGTDGFTVNREEAARWLRRAQLEAPALPPQKDPAVVRTPTGP